MAGLAGACGDDDDPGTIYDAPTGGGNFDAPPGGGSPDAATAVNIPVTLTRGAEVPACAAGGASAGGDGTVSINAAGTEITVNIMFSGLSGAVSMGHIHFGNTGAMGPVVIPFPTPITTPYQQTFDSGDYTAAGGSPATFAGFITAMKAGGAYINLHTAACGSGEIRAQIMQ